MKSGDITADTQFSFAIYFKFKTVLLYFLYTTLKIVLASWLVFFVCPFSIEFIPGTNETPGSFPLFSVSSFSTSFNRDTELIIISTFSFQLIINLKLKTRYANCISWLPVVFI